MRLPTEQQVALAEELGIKNPYQYSPAQLGGMLSAATKHRRIVSRLEFLGIEVLSGKGDASLQAMIDSEVDRRFEELGLTEGQELQLRRGGYSEFSYYKACTVVRVFLDSRLLRVDWGDGDEANKPWENVVLELAGYDPPWRDHR